MEESFRIFVKIKDLPKNGKIIVIKKSWNFEMLIEKISQKFNLKVIKIYLVIKKNNEEEVILSNNRYIKLFFLST